MTAPMEGFPPAPGQQVTLANWRTAPSSRWAFHHVRELVPSADIANDPDRAEATTPAWADLGGLAVPGDGGAPTLDDVLRETATDGVAIVHRGRLVFERYAGGTTAESPHILMSVSKSLLGLLAGALAGTRVLDPSRLVTDYVPEMAATAYRGATVRDLLDMRAGVAFDEDYLATAGPIVAYRKATGWNAPDPGERPSDLRSFLTTLVAPAGPHGGPFSYVSPNSDLLGWVIERAAGRRYADLMSELIWRPMRAVRSAYVTVDRLGAPRAAGGMCATVRDLARVGEVIAAGGARGPAQIVPEGWVEDIAGGGDPAAWAAGNFADYFPGRPMRYRSKWYVDDGGRLVFGVGIHGQHLFVDRAADLVVAKVSSGAEPLDRRAIAMTMRAVAAIRGALSGAA